MLEVAATETAREQLAALKQSNPSLFESVRARIGDVREDPGGAAAGRAFLLDDGTSARLATYYDPVAARDLVLVWTVSADPPCMNVIRIEHV